MSRSAVLALCLCLVLGLPGFFAMAEESVPYKKWEEAIKREAGRGRRSLAAAQPIAAPSPPPPPQSPPPPPPSRIYG